MIFREKEEDQAKYESNIYTDRSTYLNIKNQCSFFVAMKKPIVWFF